MTAGTRLIALAVWCTASISAGASELLLITPERVSSEAIRQWKAEKFTGVALLLEETNQPALKTAARNLQAAGVPHYYWIEVGRNARMAQERPRWMASLGMHDDWQKRFPGIMPPKSGEVGKAFPWTPINYKEAFDAHLARVKQMLADAPTNRSGVLLNHLQGGPSSCGCGNLQCRWATDYHVSATGTFAGEDAAAKFVRALRNHAPVIPVWTTECERDDLPVEKTGKSTGLCGTVGCATGACPRDFTKQWNHLVKQHDGPIAILALHREFGRTNSAFAHGPVWIERAVGYLDETVPKNGGTRLDRTRLWVVVEGRTPEEEHKARQSALQAGAATVIVARIRLDQSFEPRIIKP